MCIEYLAVGSNHFHVNSKLRYIGFFYIFFLNLTISLLDVPVEVTAIYLYNYTNYITIILSSKNANI